MSAACCVVPRKAGARRCFHPSEQARRGPRWFGIGGSLGPGVVLALLPKCPVCVAAYLAVFTGAGIAPPVAEYLRPVLAVAFAVSVIYLVVSLRRRGVTASQS